MQNVLESNEWREIWVLKIFKSEIQNGGRNNSVFLQIRLPQKLAPPHPPLFNLCKFQKSEQATRESNRMHWNLMNDEEFWSLQVLQLKHRSGTK